ncbi:MAG TPA: hypothetical protein VLG46_14390, partial [Anaerolineae bacterium]|nr:hypothetical protein [Anaerolineae bacterium]
MIESSKRRQISGWLPGVIVLWTCLVLGACAPSFSTKLIAPTPFHSALPTPTRTPDLFCRDDFVVANGKGGLRCQTTGVPYRFIGINARELAYLGDQNPALTKPDLYRVDLTGTNPGILQRQLEVASRMGVKVVRIFAPRFYDLNTDIRTLSDILRANDKLLAVSSLLEEHRRIQPLKYLIVLTDFYAAAPGFNVYNLHCPGYAEHDFSDPWCVARESMPPHLEPEWFSQGYAQPTFGEGSYREYVETLIRHYNEPVTLPVNNGDWRGIQVIGSFTVKVQIKPEQIFAWELGNELQVDAPQQAVAFMQGFVQDMACFVREVDRHPRLVASGFVSTFHATNGQSRDPAQLYDLRCADGRPVFDLGTIHGYNNQWSIPRAAPLPDYERNFGDRLEQYVDYRWFAARGLPFLMEELGFTGGNQLHTDEACMDGSYPLANDVWSG